MEYVYMASIKDLHRLKELREDIFNLSDSFGIKESDLNNEQKEYIAKQDYLIKIEYTDEMKEFSVKCEKRLIDKAKEELTNEEKEKKKKEREKFALYQIALKYAMMHSMKKELKPYLDFDYKANHMHNLDDIDPKELWSNYLQGPYKSINKDQKSQNKFIKRKMDKLQDLYIEQEKNNKSENKDYILLSILGARFDLQERDYENYENGTNRTLEQTRKDFISQYSHLIGKEGMKVYDEIENYITDKQDIGLEILDATSKNENDVYNDPMKELLKPYGYKSIDEREKESEIEDSKDDEELQKIINIYKDIRI